MLEVCVIIAAKDAAATIQRAVRSALREPQVAEVVVVDDGSTDATAQESAVRPTTAPAACVC